MTITLEERFVRACLAVSATERQAVFHALLNLERALCDPRLYAGAGLRKLHPSGIWEVRLSLSLRALFTLGSGTASFLFLGTHGEVKRFLRGL